MWKCESKSCSCCYKAETRVLLCFLNVILFFGLFLRGTSEADLCLELNSSKQVWSRCSEEALEQWQSHSWLCVENERRSFLCKHSGSRRELDTNSRWQPAVEQGRRSQKWDNPRTSGYKASHCYSNPDWLRTSSVWFMHCPAPPPSSPDEPASAALAPCASVRD